MIHKIKAIQCIQNNVTFYITTLSSEILSNICYVSRREEDSQLGFQRSLNESRAKDIARYLDIHKGIIPSAIILSAQPCAAFSFDKKNSLISFEGDINSFMVLDGQHRLFGLTKCENRYDIPVIIFNKLNTADEVNLFVDINTTQKGVPTTLLLDIKNLSGKETKKEEKQRILFDRLNDSSVMAGLLSPNKSKTGKITRVAFNLATNDLFDNSLFNNQDIDIVYKSVSNYLEASETVLSKSKTDKGKLTNSIVFRAVFALLEDVLTKSLNEYSDLKTTSICHVLEPISMINYDIYTGSSNSAYSKLLSEMKKELNNKNRYLNFKDSSIF